MIGDPCVVTKDGVVLFVRLIPNASKNRVEGIQESPEGKFRLKAKVTVIPEKGKANKALIKLLSKFLGYPSNDLKIVSGHTDRNKNILITGQADKVIENLKTRIAALS